MANSASSTGIQLHSSISSTRILSTTTTASHAIAPTSDRFSYTDYTRMDLSDHVISGSLTIVTLFKDVSALIPHAGPLTQVMGVTKELISVINEMKDNKDGCEYLVERVLLFVKNLIEEMTRMNVPLRDGTPTAARVYALAMNIRAIKEDAEKWRDWNAWKRLANRSAIKIGLSRHGQNLSDCFQTFSVQTLLHLGALVDSSSPLTGGVGRNTPVDDPESVATPASDLNAPSAAAGLRLLLHRPAGRVVLQQISRAVQTRAQDLGVSSADFASTSNAGVAPVPESRSTGLMAPTARQNTEADDHTQYLKRRVEELNKKVNGRLHAIQYNKMQYGGVQFRAHNPETGDPTDQLRKTIKVTFDILDQLQGPTEVLAETFALKLSDLSLNLCDLGLQEEALTVQTFNVIFRREAAQRHVESKICQMELAHCLNNLSIHLSVLGRLDAALTNINEAVVLARQSAVICPETTNADLALFLTTLSTCYYDIDSCEEALRASEEAITLYRLLAGTRPKTFSSQLSSSLNNMSVFLIGLGRQEDALLAIKEAIRLDKHLAAKSPAAFAPNLASSLNNFSSCLLKFGRHADALDAIKEAVKVYRQLAADRPLVFNPYLATSLKNLSSQLSHMIRTEDALEAIEESVALRRELAASRPDLFNSVLSRSLEVLSRRLSSLGRKDEALRVSTEAIELKNTS